MTDVPAPTWRDLRGETSELLQPLPRSLSLLPPSLFSPRPYLSPPPLFFSLLIWITHLLTEFFVSTLPAITRPLSVFPPQSLTPVHAVAPATLPRPRPASPRRFRDHLVSDDSFPLNHRLFVASALMRAC